MRIKKKSLSDQCLVSSTKEFKSLNASKIKNKYFLSKSKSEDKLNLKTNLKPLKETSKKPFGNFIKPSSLFKFKKFKPKFASKQPQIPTIIEINEEFKQSNQNICIQTNKKENTVIHVQAKPNNQRKTSIVLQAAALLNFENYTDMNAKIELIKKSMMDNLNRLIERDASLMDLETKADNLNKDTLNLNMISNKINKLNTKKKLQHRIIFCIVVFF